MGASPVFVSKVLIMRFSCRSVALCTMFASGLVFAGMSFRTAVAAEDSEQPSKQEEADKKDKDKDEPKAESSGAKKDEDTEAKPKGPAAEAASPGAKSKYPPYEE